jgi:adenine-specific DNA-methyltransferase
MRSGNKPNELEGKTQVPTLEWIGKDKVINHHQDVPYRVLEHKYTYMDGAKGEEQPDGNKIIRGDNLAALKSLLPQYEGKIKCIYIDPPYNTGNEGWVYNDNVNDPKIKKWLNQVVGKEGEDLSRHDKWLCMMYPRLILLQRLLHPQSGVIFISIDENEFANLKLICGDIFGTTHHVATISWQKRYSRENREAIGDSHEYILIYAGDKNIFKETRHYLPLGTKQLKIYSNSDNDPRGSWQSVSLLAQGYRPNQMYEIVAPNGRIHKPPEGNCWKVIKAEYEKALKDNRVWFGDDGNGVPRRKQFLSESKGLVPWTWWPHEEVGHTDEAKKEIYSILGKTESFDTPKPTRLIGRILQIATDGDSIILDSFAGSGTTAHAVLNLNKQDGGHRKFILVEMEDYAETITAERVRRVIDGYANVEGTGGSFSFYELGEPLILEDGNLNENIPVERIREYVFYMETKCPLPQMAERAVFSQPGNPHYLGRHANTDYYFYYERDRITTLDKAFLGTLNNPAESYVIYADKCKIALEDLKKFGVVFKKIPRDIARL